MEAGGQTSNGFPPAFILLKKKEVLNGLIGASQKIEKGEIGSFDSLLRVLRTLGKLDVFQPLVDEEQLSPSGMLLQQRNITEYHFKRLLI